MFFSEDEAINFDVNTANNNTFNSFEYKAKILEHTVVDENDSILKKYNNS